MDRGLQKRSLESKWLSLTTANDSSIALHEHPYLIETHSISHSRTVCCTY